MTFCGKLSILDKSTLEIMKTILPKYTAFRLRVSKNMKLQPFIFRHTNLHLSGPTSNRDLLSTIGLKFPDLTELQIYHERKSSHGFNPERINSGKKDHRQERYYIHFNVEQFKNLTKLVYESNDSCLLDLEVLPKNLKTLKLDCVSYDYDENEPSEQVSGGHSVYTPSKQLKLPSGFKDLKVYVDENIIVDDLPNTLTRLKISFDSKVMINETRYPKSLKTMMMCNVKGQVCNVDLLPIYLERLVLFSEFMGSMDHLPITLTHIALGNTFDQPLDHLPSCLISLQIGIEGSGEFNQPIDHLPESLEQLSIDGIFDQDISLLPKNLKVLELMGEYDRPLPISMPNLHSLGLGGNYNIPLINLPTTLKCLNLGDSFHQSMDLRSTNIERLRVGLWFGERRLFGEWPNGIIPGPLCSIKNIDRDHIFYTSKGITGDMIRYDIIDNNGFIIFDRQKYFKLLDA